jgi:pre-mRNA-splicing factor CWC22
MKEEEEEEEDGARTERKRDRDRRREDHRSDRKEEDAYAERKKRHRSGGEEDGSTALPSNVQRGARTEALLLNPKPRIEEEEEYARTDRKRHRSGRREEEEEDLRTERKMEKGGVGGGHSRHRSDRRGEEEEDSQKRERNGGGESRYRAKRREEDEEDRAPMDRKRERDGGGDRHRSEMEKDYDRIDQSKAKVQELEKDEPAVDVRRAQNAHGAIRSERVMEGAIGERAAEKPIEQAAGRSGGVYVPPFKLAQMMRDVKDKSSAQYQRMTWDALRKSINGLVNKVNASNIKNILPELFGENLIRGRGLFARSCMKSQMASPAFTHVFAALVAVVNTKFPELGELLLKRIILQLRRAFKRNDKVSPLTLVHRFSRKICMY